MIFTLQHGSEGYIGIVLHSNNKDVSSAKELLTQEQYDEINLKEDQFGENGEEHVIKEENLVIDQDGGIKHEDAERNEEMGDSIQTEEPELKKIKVEE